jgi:hypothetical protein
MSVETPLELGHLITRLHADFDGRLLPAANGTPADKEKNFLTRALAAFAIHRLADGALDAAAASVVDGGGDFGLDAIFMSAPAATLWLVQSKFDASGRGEPNLGDVSKFCDGVDALLRGNFAPFAANTQIMVRQQDILRALKIAGLQVRTVLVYSGLAVVSQDRRHLFDRLIATWSPDTDYLTVTSYNLTTVHDWVTGADDEAGVEKLELTIAKPGWVTAPYETIYGCIPLTVLKSLWEAHGKRLIAANLRGYKGSTDVNDGIRKTIKEEPHFFFYLNNGLTAYCERMEVENTDRANSEQKRVTFYGFSIVNGAQTLGSAADQVAQLGDPPPNGHAFIKVIALRGCDDNRAFAVRLTQSTNFQNHVTARDFVSLEEEQAVIASGLALSGIAYHYKDTDDTPAPDASNFTLDEATSALACLEQQAGCDLLSRIVAQRKALWSFDAVYPEGEVHRSRYARLFKNCRSARSIWRAVQTQRVVKSALQSNESGVRKEFFENGRWLVLNLIFLRLHPQDGEALALTVEERATITTVSQEFSEKLWTVCQSKGYVSAKAAGGWETPRHFRSVFSDADDCARLRNETLAILAQQGNAQ